MVIFMLSCTRYKRVCIGCTISLFSKYAVEGVGRQRADPRQQHNTKAAKGDNRYMGRQG